MPDEKTNDHSTNSYEELKSSGSKNIVICSEFAGILRGDPQSWINVELCWTPDKEQLLDEKDDKDKEDGEGRWTLASIIRLSGLSVSH